MLKLIRFHSVIAVSITRLVYLLALDGASPDVNWNFAGTQIWTCVEMNIAIVSGEWRVPSCSARENRDLASGTTTENGWRWFTVANANMSGRLPSFAPPHPLSPYHRHPEPFLRPIRRTEIPGWFQARFLQPLGEHEKHRNPVGSWRSHWNVSG